MGIFGNVSLNNVKESEGGGYYYEPGEYEAELDRIRVVPCRDGDKMFLAETKIITSTNPSRAVGSRPSITQKTMGKHADYAGRRIRALIIALTGFDARNPKDAVLIDKIDWDSVLELAPEVQNPKTGDVTGNRFKGVRFLVHATQGKLITSGKHTGQYFTNLSYSPVAELSDLQNAMREIAISEIKS